MTRHELAEAINAQVYRLSGEVTTIDANHIGKWERGVIRWPAQRYRTALRTLVGAATDGELGFTSPRARCHGDDVNRKQFLKTVGVGVGGLLAAPPAEGTTIDLARSIAGPTQHYRQMEGTVSAHQLAPAVDSHWQLASTVVGQHLHSPSSYAVLAEVAGLSAWLATDRGDTATARNRCAAGIRHAEAASHPLLVCYMTGSLAQYATDMGDVQHGLRLLDRAADHLDDTSPPPARAWLSAVSAVAHASSGDPAAATAALRTAHRCADREPGETTWPWIFAVTATKVARYEASTLLRLGDVTGAHTAYTTAIDSAATPKAKALMQAEYAQALARHGDSAEATAFAQEALRTGQRYDSERVISHVRALRSDLPHSGDVRALDHALATLYTEDIS